jgi:hypothetical protein
VESRNLPVYLFETRERVEEAIRALSAAGIDMTKLSLVGKGVHSEEQPVGFYSSGDKIRTWGATGAFWGGVWGLLLAPAIFVLPGIGVVALAGPVVAALVSSLEGAAIVGGLSALGATLMQLGIPRESAIKYQLALKVDKYVLLVHGTEAEMARARTVVSNLVLAASTA